MGPRNPETEENEYVDDQGRLVKHEVITDVRHYEYPEVDYADDDEPDPAPRRRR